MPNTQRKGKYGVELKGMQSLTLLDFPGHVACTVFTGGCNFRCPFCHNASLVRGAAALPPLDTEEFFRFLLRRRGILDGVAVTGGEPLLQDGIAAFLTRVRSLGYAVKLDTNGSFPDKLRALMEAGLLDYVAMDVKNAPDKYQATAGYGDTDRISESIELLKSGGVPYEFRTTAVRELHTADDFAAIGRWIRGAERYFIQCFKDSGDILEGGMSAPDAEALRAYLAAAREFVPAAALRGVD